MVFPRGGSLLSLGPFCNFFSQERIERPRPITVDDLEARPGSPSIIMVQGDGSGTGSASSLKDRGLYWMSVLVVLLLLKL